MSSNSDKTTEQTKAKIYTEQVKQRHVTHWDLDYLPREAMKPRCPSCNVEVVPGQPGCIECGEQLYVEHPGAFPRDANAVDSTLFSIDS